jgi:hypothetical protein
MLDRPSIAVRRELLGVTDGASTDHRRGRGARRALKRAKKAEGDATGEPNALPLDESKRKPRDKSGDQKRDRKPRRNRNVGMSRDLPADTARKSGGLESPNKKPRTARKNLLDAMLRTRATHPREIRRSRNKRRGLIVPTIITESFTFDGTAGQGLLDTEAYLPPDIEAYRVVSFRISLLCDAAAPGVDIPTEIYFYDLNLAKRVTLIAAPVVVAGAPIAWDFPCDLISPRNTRIEIVVNNGAVLPAVGTLLWDFQITAPTRGGGST